jgi:four helix bundle protein
VIKRVCLCLKAAIKIRTSIGAMIREAEHAESKQDFIHKFAVAQKRNEVVYWLELLKATDYLNEKNMKI